MDPTADLLRTIAEVLDIRGVFPRISEIAQGALRHDCLELLVYGPADDLARQIRSTDTFPEHRHRRLACGGEFDIIPDLRLLPSRFPQWDSGDFVERVVAAGYRSRLSVRRVAHRQRIELGFFSKQSHAYDEPDLVAARRIADCLMVAVSHEQLAAEDRERTEEQARAERLDLRVRKVADITDVKPDGRRVVGQSAAWRRVLTRATQVAATDTTVFVQGESGTGKEVVARFIHQASPRKHGPFVAINCAALPEALLESELFGYERGAFTGANHAKVGQIELASKGVLFLDEVSEMSLAGQAKLLRFLQEREFQRLGGTQLLKANVRVIAASNRDLRQAVDQREFREDLYYRLQVFDIRVPPLRERAGDILILAGAFLQDLSGAHGRPPASLTPEAVQMLVTYGWPGNVRQLHNTLERATILSDGGPIAPRHLALDGDDRTPARANDLGTVERRTIEQVLREAEGNKSKAATRLGITRAQLYFRLRKYGLEAPGLADRRDEGRDWHHG